MISTAPSEARELLDDQLAFESSMVRQAYKHCGCARKERLPKRPRLALSKR